ncbi:hypothetical protein [Streptomyces sp. NBC_01483]|uniref:hypothetical protein n=1 Tax=Streptomyces sp. NBC_01483 TaxID=2903883 RepID=UPI002E36E4B1|nr:hypothetical protein [Streptomyces sp. NBC_01483]
MSSVQPCPAACPRSYSASSTDSDLSQVVGYWIDTHLHGAPASQPDTPSPIPQHARTDPGPA